MESNLLQRLWARDSVRVVVGMIGLCAVYFLVPVRTVDPGALWRVLAVVVLVGALSFVVVDHLRSDASRLSSLVLLLALIVLSFSLLFYVVATRNPDEFSGLDTRVDALYFTLTTMTTTGYGDIVATGQLSRGLVIAVFVFDLVYLALLIGGIGRAFERLRDRREQGTE